MMNMFTKLSLLVAVALVASGCASNLERASASPDQIRPVAKITHSVEEGKAQYALGKYYLGQGRNGLALAAFTEAVSHDPANPDARNGRAIVLVKVGDFKGAVRELETAVASNPTQVHLLNNLAYAHMLDGALVLAADSLQRALELEPDNRKARENWEDLTKRAAGNPELAAKLANSAPPAPAPILEFDKPKVAPVVPTAPRTHSVISIDFGIGLATAVPVSHQPGLVALAVDVRSVASESPLLVSGPGVVPLLARVGTLVGGSDLLATGPVLARQSLIWNVVPADAIRAGQIELAATPGLDDPLGSPSILAGIVPTELGATLGYDLNRVLIEVSNGNGIERMARVLGGALKRHNLRIWSFSNAKHFDHPVTQIFFDEKSANEARAISQMLPVQAELIPNPEALNGTDIRIVIGRDIHSHEMAEELIPIELQKQV